MRYSENREKRTGARIERERERERERDRERDETNKEIKIYCVKNRRYKNMEIKETQGEPLLPK